MVTEFKIVFEADAEYTAGPTFERLQAEKRAQEEQAQQEDQGSKPSEPEESR